jgi:hypothetical protein
VRATTRIAVFAILPALGAGLVAFAPSILLAHHRIIALALGLAVYPVALYLVGGLSLQDLVHLRGALRSAATPDVGRGEDGT